MAFPTLNSARATLLKSSPRTQREILHAAALRIVNRSGSSKLKPYAYDFAAWLMDCVDWPEGRKPTEYQLGIASAIFEHLRVAEHGPHGIGKTGLAALFLHFFALTSEALEMDWKAITTAGSNTQLKQYLWPEVHKWVPLLKWGVMGREPYNQLELQEMSIKLRHGRAFAVNSANHTLIEGAHAKRLAYLFDEAKAIPDATFDATEGAFANVGTYGYEAYAVALSTPGEEQGRLYDICSQKPGYEDWHVIAVTSEMAVAAGMHSKKWIRARARQWGVDSQLYQNRVLGHFSSRTNTGVIPLAWLEAANERWREWTKDEKGNTKDVRELGIVAKIGVDAAWEGDDKSALATAFSGNRVYSVVAFEKNSPMEIAGRAHSIKERLGGTPVVDVIGIGAGVFSRLKELGDDPVAFNASESPGEEINPHTGQLEPVKDRLGEFGFVNKRAHAWWQLREKLDPEYGSQTICIPPDPILMGDLTAVRYKHTSSGKIQIEEKEQIKKRLKRSTDYGDAVVQALYDPVAGSLHMEAW